MKRQKSLFLLAVLLIWAAVLPAAMGEAPEKKTAEENGLHIYFLVSNNKTMEQSAVRAFYADIVTQVSALFAHGNTVATVVPLREEKNKSASGIDWALGEDISFISEIRAEVEGLKTKGYNDKNFPIGDVILTTLEKDVLERAWLREDGLEPIVFMMSDRSDEGTLPYHMAETFSQNMVPFYFIAIDKSDPNQKGKTVEGNPEYLRPWLGTARVELGNTKKTPGYYGFRVSMEDQNTETAHRIALQAFMEEARLGRLNLPDWKTLPLTDKALPESTLSPAWKAEDAGLTLVLSQAAAQGQEKVRFLALWEEAPDTLNITSKGESRTAAPAYALLGRTAVIVLSGLEDQLYEIKALAKRDKQIPLLGVTELRLYRPASLRAEFGAEAEAAAKNKPFSVAGKLYYEDAPAADFLHQGWSYTLVVKRDGAEEKRWQGDIENGAFQTEQYMFSAQGAYMMEVEAISAITGERVTAASKTLQIGNSAPVLRPGAVPGDVVAFENTVYVAMPWEEGIIQNIPESLLLTSYFEDPDGDALRFGVVGNPAYVKIEGERLVFAPDETMASGLYECVVEAEDNDGGVCRLPVRFRLENIRGHITSLQMGSLQIAPAGEAAEAGESGPHLFQKNDALVFSLAFSGDEATRASLQLLKDAGMWDAFVSGLSVRAGIGRWGGPGVEMELPAQAGTPGEDPVWRLPYSAPVQSGAYEAWVKASAFGMELAAQGEKAAFQVEEHALEKRGDMAETLYLAHMLLERFNQPVSHAFSLADYVAVEPTDILTVTLIQGNVILQAQDGVWTVHPAAEEAAGGERAFVWDVAAQGEQKLLVTADRAGDMAFTLHIQSQDENDPGVSVAAAVSVRYKDAVLTIVLLGATALAALALAVVYSVRKPAFHGACLRLTYGEAPGKLRFGAFESRVPLRNWGKKPVSLGTLAAAAGIPLLDAGQAALLKESMIWPGRQGVRLVPGKGASGKIEIAGGKRLGGKKVELAFSEPVVLSMGDARLTLMLERE